MGTHIRSALLLLLGLGLAAPALAAEVRGRVVDPAGDPLPGVVVTLRAPSGAVVSAVSDQAGRYTIPCAPGDYVLRAELQGFAPAARPVTVGTAALPVDLSLALAGFSEQVTVRAELPRAVLGAAQPDAPDTVTRQVVDAGMLPNSQYDDVLPLLPNVVRGPDGQISVAGSRPPQSALFVNGVNETDPIVGEPRLMLPLEAVDTMDVFAGGYAAELGPATGGVTAVHTRAGSDQVHASATSFMPRLRFPGGAMRIESWEPNLGVSGPIGGRRASFEGSVSYRFDVERFETLAGQQENAFRALLAWTQVDLGVSPSQRVSVSLSADPQRTDHAAITAFTPAATVPALARGGWTLTAADHLVLGKSAVAEIRAGTNRSGLTLTPDGAIPFAIGHDVARGSYFDAEDLAGDRVEGGADLAWTGWHGHVVKVGGSLAHVSVGGTSSAAAVRLLQSDGSVSREIDFTGAPGRLHAAEGEEALFAQDTWTPTRFLAIDSGLRYDRSSALRGARLLPRTAWTLKLGDGRATITGSAGWFADEVPLRAELFPQLPSRVVRTFDSQGALVSIESFANAIDGALWMPLAARWDLEFDRRFASGWLTRVRYQERRGRDEAIATPIAGAGGAGLLMLTSTGRSRSRSLEATVAYRPPGDGDQFYLSYVRSGTRGDLNRFDLVEGIFRQPLVEPDAIGPLPADVPDRLLAWGVLHLPWRLEASPFVEVRDGFPFTAIGEDGLRVEAPNRRRYPWFGSLDLYLNRIVRLPFHLPQARVGLKAYNLLSVHTERDIQADIARADFARTYNAIPRDYTAVLEFLWGH